MDYSCWHVGKTNLYNFANEWMNKKRNNFEFQCRSHCLRPAREACGLRALFKAPGFSRCALKVLSQHMFDCSWIGVGVRLHCITFSKAAIITRIQNAKTFSIIFVRMFSIIITSLSASIQRKHIFFGHLKKKIKSCRKWNCCCSVIFHNSNPLPWNIYAWCHFLFPNHFQVIQSNVSVSSSISSRRIFTLMRMGWLLVMLFLCWFGFRPLFTQ